MKVGVGEAGRNAGTVENLQRGVKTPAAGTGVVSGFAGAGNQGEKISSKNNRMWAQDRRSAAAS